jgi:hypothetical protein
LELLPAGSTVPVSPCAIEKLRSSSRTLCGLLVVSELLAADPANETLIHWHSKLGGLSYVVVSANVDLDR